MAALKCLLYFFLIFPFFLKIESKEQRNLAIVLDLVNQEIGHSNMSVLIHGLVESEIPILTTLSVLENYKIDFHDTLQKEKCCIYRKNNFVLLVPTIYLDDYNHGFNLSGFYKDEYFFSNNSLIMQQYQHAKSLIYNLIKFSLLFEITLKINSDKFIKLFEQLVKSKNELQDIEWNIYMLGHGMPIFTTCGLTETCFKKFLDILEKKLNIHTFYYVSCYSGGKQKDHVFTNNAKYSFPIFCQCLNDNTANISRAFNYKTLFTQLEKIDNNKKETFCNLVENVFDQFEITNHNPMNIVTVRFPNKREFEIIDIESKVLSISSTNMVPDEIKCKNIILNTAYFNSTLNLTADTKIATFLKGDAVHYIERINAEKVDYVRLFINFISVEDLIYRKIFLINEINCLDPLGNKIRLKNVILFLNCSTPMQKQIVNFEGFVIDDNNKAFVIYLNKYVLQCGCQKTSCYHYKTNELQPQITEKYIHCFKKIKNQTEQNQQLDRKIYDAQVRNSYILCRQGSEILKPIICGSLLYNLLKSNNVKNNTVVQYCKNLFIFYFIYSRLNEKSRKYINSIFNKISESEGVLNDFY